MIGFELELSSVLIYALLKDDKLASAEKNIPPQVLTFLSGRVGYGQEVGRTAEPKPPSHFTLKADTRSYEPRGELLKYLAAKNYIPKSENPLAFLVHSILEYVTGPIDEHQADADQLFKTEASILKEHMNKIIQLARGSQQAIPLPAQPGYYVGVPFVELNNWVSPADREKVAELAKDCASKVNDEIYIQATVGIVPSSIPFFFRNLTSSLIYIEATNIIAETVSQLMDNAAFKNDVYLQKMQRIDKDALHGFLYLTFAYMVFDTMAQTEGVLNPGVSNKNATPLLIQMAPERLPQRTGTLYLRNNPLPENLLKLVIDTFTTSKYCTVPYWQQQLQSLKQRKLLKEDAVAQQVPWRPRHLIQGDGSHTDFICQLLGSGKVNKPVDTPNEQKLPGDKLPEKLEAQSLGQVGIPFEYRDLLVPLSPDTLLKSMLEIVEGARSLNLLSIED